MTDIINPPMRKGIKIMAKVAHVANAISQMPQPKDFALMITSDIIYMSGQVQSITQRLRSMLDGYTDVPFEFLESHFNGIMNTATDLIGRVDSYVNDNIATTMNLGVDLINMPTELVSTSIDMYGEVSNIVIDISKNTGAIFSKEGRNEDTQGKINDAIRDLQNKNNIKTQNAKNQALESLEKASDSVEKAKDKATGWVSSKTGKLNNEIIGFQDNVMKLLNKIRNAVNEFSNSVDKSFGVSSSQKAAALDVLGTISSIDRESGDEFENLAAVAVSETANIIGGIIENFSIGKFVTACAGMSASIILVQTGLDKLPKIDTDKILSCINGIEQKLIKSNLTYIDDLVQYNPSMYNKFKEQYEEELQKQRNSLRKKMSARRKRTSIIQELNADLKARKNFMSGLSDDEKTQMKSAIKEMRKKRKQARKGKKTNKIKDTILSELKKFYDEVKALLKRVKDKWFTMIDNYKQTINEIKDFFTMGGYGDKTIEKICEDINQNCNDIKKLCTIDLPIQIANVCADVVMPRAIGLCFPNFSQHIIQFFGEVKVIIKFIMDLLRYVMNIIRDVNDLAHIILNGINNLAEIIKQLMSFLGLGWIINLIKKIQAAFNSSMAATVEMLENTLEPIYFEDTEKYEQMMDDIDSLIDQELPEGMTTRSLVNNIFSYVAGNGKLTENIGKVLSYNLARDIYNGSAKEDDIEELTDRLDDIGKTIVAYRSPVFKKNNDGKIIVTDDDGNTTEPKLEAYLYYHPDLYHYSTSSFGIFGKMRRRRKSRFIKKASKRSNSKNGGVNMLRRKSRLFYNRNSHKNVSAWDAFYWYKVVTNDFNVDFLGTDNTTKEITKVVFNTSSGSVVLIDTGNGNTQKVFVKDANVKSGDYVNYNGRKYKIL